jgi:PadR family transcriptional regulator PadR
MSTIDERARSASDPMDKWEIQLRKGCLELAILGSLWSGRQYGLEILRSLERDSELVLSEGTVYPLLSRLKTDGLLESEWVEAEGGHPRKYYRLTRAGRRRAMQMARLWRRFSASLGGLLAPLLEEGRPS